MNKIIRGWVLIATMAFLPHAAAADTVAFDGNWDVTLACPKSDDGAKAYSYEFSATVKDGELHGERGTANEPGWMALDGPIKADGSASLLAEGVVNISAYAVGNGQKGTAYRHAVQAQFQSKSGSGSWNYGRIYTFTFTKEK